MTWLDKKRRDKTRKEKTFHPTPPHMHIVSKGSSFVPKLLAKERHYIREADDMLTIVTKLADGDCEKAWELLRQAAKEE